MFNHTIAELIEHCYCILLRIIRIIVLYTIFVLFSIG